MRLGIGLASCKLISQFWRLGLGKVRGTGTRVVDGIKGVVDIVEMGLGLGLGLAALRGSGERWRAFAFWAWRSLHELNWE